MKYLNTYKINLQCQHECKKCAARNNAIKGQEKSKKTCLQHWGVQFSFQSQNNKLKSIQTKLKKYGPDWKRIQAGRMCKGWHYDQNGKLLNHNGSNPETRRKMVQGWKRTVSKKPLEELQKWRAKIVGNSKSKICEKFLNQLSSFLNIKIQSQKAFGTKYVDGYIQNKLIIQFYGDYWHCNPAVFNKDDVVLRHHKNFTVQQIWDSDKNRNLQVLKYSNLPLIIIWQYDYINNKEQLFEKIKKGYINNEYINGQIYVI